MQPNKEKFYLTVPIFYPNADLHMGHAYTTTVADIIARYQKIIGKEVYFLSGSDENTQKVVQVAGKEGKTAKVFLDEKVANFKKLFTKLNISYDQFIRTSDEEKHWPGAVALWKKLEAAGDLGKRFYEGLYCVGHEAFLTEKELVDGKCPDHGTTPEFVREENWFFKLSKYTKPIREEISSGRFSIVPESRKNEILSLLDRGLEDVSFSRPRKDGGLGIPVPGDDSQIMYVWCDALSNYITALGYGQEGDSLYKKFWPADMHVIGKDILRFHAAIWPGMLLSAGLPLPKKLLVHGFITSGGKKMSKTIGNVIDPVELLEEYGTDAVRYYLARHISPFEDGDMTLEGFKEVYNGELANGVGNLVSRVMKLSEDYSVTTLIPNFSFPPHMRQAMESFKFNDAMSFVWQRIQAADRYMNENEPYKVIKTDVVTGKVHIQVLVQYIFEVGKMLEPFMPDTSKKILEAVVNNKKPENLFVRKD